MAQQIDSNSTLHTAEDRISQHENKSIKNTKTKAQKQQQDGKKLKSRKGI